MAAVEGKGGNRDSNPGTKHHGGLDPRGVVAEEPPGMKFITGEVTPAKLLIPQHTCREEG